MIKGSETMEAREFFKGNKNKYAFASNKFGSTAAAVKFVEALYAAGATRVEVTYILAEDWRLREEGGAYASALHLHIPTGNTQVLRIAAGKKPDEFSIEADGFVRIWWD